MDNKLRKFADWHGIDTRDAGSLLLAAADIDEFTSLDTSCFETMGIKSGDSIEEVTSAIRKSISDLKDKQSKLESTEEKKAVDPITYDYDIGLLNLVLELLE